jgi:hypothetical protein
MAKHFSEELTRHENWQQNGLISQQQHHKHFATESWKLSGDGGL